jgi:hypothetical protein
MPEQLAKQSIALLNYPEDVRLPGDEATSGRSKGISDLTIHERARLLEALRETDKTLRIHFRYTPDARGDYVKNKKPVIIGIAPPADSVHLQGRRKFANGTSDRSGPRRTFAPAKKALSPDSDPPSDDVHTLMLPRKSSPAVGEMKRVKARKIKKSSKTVALSDTDEEPVEEGSREELPSEGKSKFTARKRKGKLLPRVSTKRVRRIVSPTNSSLSEDDVPSVVKRKENAPPAAAAKQPDETAPPAAQPKAVRFAEASDIGRKQSPAAPKGKTNFFNRHKLFTNPSELPHKPREVPSSDAARNETADPLPAAALDTQLAGERLASHKQRDREQQSGEQRDGEQQGGGLPYEQSVRYGYAEPVGYGAPMSHYVHPPQGYQQVYRGGPPPSTRHFYSTFRDPEYRYGPYDPHAIPQPYHGEIPHPIGQEQYPGQLREYHPAGPPAIPPYEPRTRVPQSGKPTIYEYHTIAPSAIRHERITRSSHSPNLAAHEYNPTGPPELPHEQRARSSRSPNPPSEG